MRSSLHVCFCVQSIRALALGKSVGSPTLTMSAAEVDVEGNSASLVRPAETGVDSPLRFVVDPRGETSSTKGSEGAATLLADGRNLVARSQTESANGIEARDATAYAPGIFSYDYYYYYPPPENGKYVKNANVAEELNYPKYSSGLPSCMLGLLYMDQLALSLPLLEEPEYPEAPYWVFGRNFAEYTTSVVKFTNDCITLGVKDRWLVGEDQPACGSDLNFCREPSFNDPCAIGEKYTYKGGLVVGRSSLLDVNESGMVGSDREMHMSVTTWGWRRDTVAHKGPITFYCTYPVFQIVDGWGFPTKWFSTFLMEANNEHECDEDYWAFPSTGKCPWNQYKHGHSVVCIESGGEDDRWGTQYYSDTASYYSAS